ALDGGAGYRGLGGGLHLVGGVAGEQLLLRAVLADVSAPGGIELAAGRTPVGRGGGGGARAAGRLGAGGAEQARSDGAARNGARHDGGTNGSFSDRIHGVWLLLSHGPTVRITRAGSSPGVSPGSDLPWNPLRLPSAAADSAHGPKLDVDVLALL